MKKRVISLLCVLIMVISSVNSFAFEYPQNFWKVNQSYETALENNNHSDIIKYGNELIEMLKNLEDSHQKRQLIVIRYKNVGISYAMLGDYDNAYNIFEELYNYTIGKEELYDYNKTAYDRMKQYKTTVALYTDGGQSTYYGAKNEKENGVLFGLCATSKTLSRLGNESMVLTYQELGYRWDSYNTGVLRTAASEGQAVELALNCPNEGADIKNIRKKESYLKEISDLLKKYPNVPVYLRFAAEFNIWTKPVDAPSFVEAFRYVSNYFKNRNDNVAIVWSPNHVSSWEVDMDDYYPGDAYVDWVGVSLYAHKYFLGDKNQPEEYEISFKTGTNADPVIAVQDIVEKYGNRKPIMISESGCCHRLAKTGEDSTDFALLRLKQYMKYLPMVYPQIKLMAYFDWFVEGEVNDYRLSANTELQDEYILATQNPRFIQDKYDTQTTFCYRKIGYGTMVGKFFPVSCYAHKHNTEIEKVTYFIDGKYEGMATEIPFTTYIDAGEYSGKHQLKAVVKFRDGDTVSTEQSIIISGVDRDVAVVIDEEEIDFNQNPVILEGRIMLPMRKIFEELGATVNWNGKTRTVIGEKGDRRVKITIDSNVMYINNKKIILDVAPLIIGASTLVPVRAVAEGLGCDVEWYDKSSLVEITTREPTWSQWSEELPDWVDSDLYYIEEQEEFRYRTKEKEYFTLDFKISAGNYVGKEKYYGDWSDWQDSYISSSDTLEVETRTVSSPKKYHYLHYCTGNLADEDSRYRTRSYWWHDECVLHDLGWLDEPLTLSPDSSSDYTIFENGKKKRCSNTCYRWYLVETIGGESTQYRSRPIYYEYTYWEWSDWSWWSGWDTEYPYDEYFDEDEYVDIEDRTVYRYKEK